jgi:hypothetical protein
MRRPDRAHLVTEVLAWFAAPGWLALRRTAREPGTPLSSSRFPGQEPGLIPAYAAGSDRAGMFIEMPAMRYAELVVC